MAFTNFNLSVFEKGENCLPVTFPFSVNKAAIFNIAREQSLYSGYWLWLKEKIRIKVESQEVDKCYRKKEKLFSQNTIKKKEK